MKKRKNRRSKRHARGNVRLLLALLAAILLFGLVAMAQQPHGAILRTNELFHPDAF